jgi:predicted phage terminase large subunit-like protein
MATYDGYPTDDDGRVSVELAKKKDLMMAAGWDTALKDKQENDFSVMYLGGLDKAGNIWVVGREKGRYTIQEIVSISKETYVKWRTMGIWFEDSAQGTPAVQTIRAEMPHVPCDTVYYSGGKRSRANVLAQYIHNGQVRFPKFVEWFADCEYYLKHFPHTDHDDDIDSLFVLVDNLLQMRHPASYEDRPEATVSMR